MGTRSLTVILDENDDEIAVLYHQYDGYPEGHGQELADYLKGKKMVNGLSGDTTMVFNGMGCLAASLIANFKTKAGGFYLYPTGTRDIGEDFIYYVKGLINEEPHILVCDSYSNAKGEPSVLFHCVASEYDNELAKHEAALRLLDEG